MMKPIGEIVEDLVQGLGIKADEASGGGHAQAPSNPQCEGGHSATENKGKTAEDMNPRQVREVNKGEANRACQCLIKGYKLITWKHHAPKSKHVANPERNPPSVAACFDLRAK
jgi:hypothetical protein